jgi:CDP-diacylglycerol--serine O-phosphatidyltransferase
MKQPRLLRKAAYALPTLFTAGNVFLGFISIMETVAGSLAASSQPDQPNAHFERAALFIGFAFLCDGLDGRIARMTNTASDFGREMDSLADVITFCLAPAVLAFAWGVRWSGGSIGPLMMEHIERAGYFCAFLFLICGALRLARFNVQVNPSPKNPGSPDRKYFVGLPTPPSACLIAAIVYACDGRPITDAPFTILWLFLVAALAVLMVSMWRYRSFKELNALKPLSPLSLLFFCGLIFLIWNYSKAVLLGLAAAYTSSGVFVRIGGAIRRRVRAAKPQAADGKELHAN